MLGVESGLGKGEGDQVRGHQGQELRGERGEVSVRDTQLTEAGEAGQQPGEAGQGLEADTRL